MSVMVDRPLPDARERLQQARQSVRHTGRFLGYALSRFVSDSCPQTAAALSYSTLLALVPLLAIGIAVLSSFPAMEDLRTQVQQLLFENLLPDAGMEISDQMAAFLENAQRMTGPGLVGLAVTVFLLLSTISNAFKRIWRVADSRSIIGRVLVYWAVVTLGPLLIAASVSLTQYGQAAVRASGLEGYAPPLLDLTGLFTLLLSVLGFALLYLVLPGRAVRLSHAVIGGFVAALLLALLRRGFALYIVNFPSYQAVYGALAAVPIFLVWMYLSWAVILFAAEIVAALPEWQFAQRGGRRTMGPGPRLALGLVILQRLRTAGREGRVVKETLLTKDLPISLEELSDALNRLARARYVTRVSTGRWVLCRHLEEVTLADLMAALKTDLESGPGWPAPLRSLIDGLAKSERSEASMSVSDLLDRLEKVETLPVGRSA